MNATQRRKNRRKGVFTYRDKQQADRFAKLLYKLCLADEPALYSGILGNYTRTLSNSFSAGYANTTIYNIQGKALEVEDINSVLKSVTFEPGDWP